jgi:hypothetical protein
MVKERERKNLRSEVCLARIKYLEQGTEANVTRLVHNTPDKSLNAIKENKVNTNACQQRRQKTKYCKLVKLEKYRTVD